MWRACGGRVPGKRFLERPEARERSDAITKCYLARGRGYRRGVASRVGELFARNGGVATTAELTALGFSYAQIRRFVRDGLLVSKRRDVYALGTQAAKMADDPPRAHALDLAAVLVHLDGACVGSHETAAITHGLDLLERPTQGTVTVTRPRPGNGSRASRRGLRVHAAEIPERDITRRYGVPVTSVARTVIDLSRARSFREGVVVADSALRSGKVTPAELQAAIASCPRWPGLRKARKVVAFSDGRAESVLESLARVIMHENRLPAPELQIWIQDGYGARIGRVDFFWPRYNTIGEADGAMKYEDSAAARKQLERDKKLRLAGYELVHFGWRGIVYETRVVIGEFLAAFDRGRPDH